MDQMKQACHGAIGKTMAPEATHDTQLDKASQVGDETRPALSVVLVTVKSFCSLRKVVRQLQRQSIVGSIELLLIAPSVANLEDMQSSDVAGFFGIRKIAAGKINDVDKVAASGIRAALAPVVTLLEDHAYPHSGWAERIVAASQNCECVAIGNSFENANPRHILSWSNMLLSYGRWVGAMEAGATDWVSRHNVSFRTSTLHERYGDRLVDYLGRDGGLLEDLRQAGHRFYLEPRAVVSHVNPSRWNSTLSLRIRAGRLYGANRAKRENWATWKRVTYAIGSPLIPVVRLARVWRELFGSDSMERRRRLGWKAAPALLIGLLLDGVGQFMGYSFGFGDSREKLAFFEMDRVEHLRDDDLPVMALD